MKLNLSSEQWCKLSGITVLDPDGWNRQNPNFQHDWKTVKISFSEFWERCCMSTTSDMRDRKHVMQTIATNLGLQELEPKTVTIQTRHGNTLSLFYNPEIGYVALDLVSSNEKGGTELFRKRLDEKLLLAHTI